jgi:hypothetical protein
MSTGQHKKIYRTLCEQGKITSLFNQPWWLEATGSWEVSLGWRNDQVVGAMPFGTRRQWGIPAIQMPAFTHHLRIWMDKPPDIAEQKWLAREKQILDSVIDGLPAYGFFSLVFDEKSFDHWLPFHWKGFRQEMRYTFVVERADPETVDSHLNRNLKRNLREAEEEIVISREVDARTFYSLCRNTYSKQHLKMPYTQEIFERLDAAITLHGAGIKLGAINNHGAFVAVSYLVWDADTAYYLMAGDNEEGRQKGASIVLCREALQIAFEERKVATFDFCGSMIEGITDMRRQFGARAVPLMKIFKARWKWLDVVYTLTR